MRRDAEGSVQWLYQKGGRNNLIELAVAWVWVEPRSEGLKSKTFMSTSPRSNQTKKGRLGGRPGDAVREVSGVRAAQVKPSTSGHKCSARQ